MYEIYRETSRQLHAIINTLLSTISHPLLRPSTNPLSKLSATGCDIVSHTTKKVLLSSAAQSQCSRSSSGPCGSEAQCCPTDGDERTFHKTKRNSFPHTIYTLYAPVDALARSPITRANPKHYKSL